MGAALGRFQGGCGPAQTLRRSPVVRKLKHTLSGAPTRHVTPMCPARSGLPAVCCQSDSASRKRSGERAVAAQCGPLQGACKRWCKHPIRNQTYTRSPISRCKADGLAAPASPPATPLPPPLRPCCWRPAALARRLPPHCPASWAGAAFAGSMVPKRKSTSKAEAAPAEAPAAKRKSSGKAAAKVAAAEEAAAEPAEAKPAAAKKAKAGALAVGELVPDVELLREDDTSVKLRASGAGAGVAVGACRGSRAVFRFRKPADVLPCCRLGITCCPTPVLGVAAHHPRDASRSGTDAPCCPQAAYMPTRCTTAAPRCRTCSWTRVVSSSCILAPTRVGGARAGDAR